MQRTKEEILALDVLELLDAQLVYNRTRATKDLHKVVRLEKEVRARCKDIVHPKPEPSKASLLDAAMGQFDPREEEPEEPLNQPYGVD